MAINTTIGGLSQSPGSNGPDGGADAPSSLDDALKYHGAFIAQLRDGKGFSAELDVTSAATCDIGGANSFLVRITGTTTITSFGTNYSGPRFIRFGGALTLTHNSSSLILPGTANITTAAGDTCIAVPISGGWAVHNYQRASTPVNGAVVDRAYAEYVANSDILSSIPLDDTIPQVSEGSEVLSVSITPKSSTNRVRVRFQAWGSSSAGAANIIAALFVNGAANAVRASWITTPLAGSPGAISLEYEHVPGSTSSQTYSIRVGGNGAAIRLNGTGSARRFGGTAAATVVVEEIAA